MRARSSVFLIRAIYRNIFSRQRPISSAKRDELWNGSLEFSFDFGQSPGRLMKFKLYAAVLGICVGPTLLAGPVIDPIPNASIPAGKSLIVPVTASSPNGRPLTFTATSSTNRIVVEVKTNEPFWKLTVVQVASANAPGAFQTPFRGGVATVTNVGDMLFILFKEVAPRTVD